MKNVAFLVPFLIALMPLAFAACGDGPEKSLVTVTSVVQASPGPTQATVEPQGFDPVVLCAKSKEENFQVTIEFDRPIVTTDGYAVVGFLFGSCGPWGSLDVFRQTHELVLGAIATEMVNSHPQSGRQLADLIPERVATSGVKFGSGPKWSWLLTKSGVIY